MVFENPAGEAHVIRQRVAFRSAQQAQVEIDVWDRDPSLPMDQWFREVENITTTVEINAAISGQDAYLRVEPGDCGVPTVYAAYVPFDDHVYKIAHPNSGDLASLAAYDEMLRSFALWAVDPETRSQSSLPDFLPRAPLTCSTNVCPSTCWYGCTFAAISEGCCGYHAVPRWQCAKECIGSEFGDFQGNCVWWAAYTRPDVGALASGNAENWAVSVKNTGQLPVDRTPKVGDTVVHPGSSYNHVAYVVWVSADRTSYMMSDMGWCGDCGPTPEETKLRTVDADDEFIHCKGNPAIPEVDWQFTDCPFGWTPSKGFSASQLDGSAWGFNPAADPFLLSPILSVPASEYNNVEVRLFSHAADTVGTIYFATASSPGFDASKSVEFAVTNDGAWHDIVVDMSSQPELAGHHHASAHRSDREWQRRWQLRRFGHRPDPLPADRHDAARAGLQRAARRLAGPLHRRHQPAIPLGPRQRRSGGQGHGGLLRGGGRLDPRGELHGRLVGGRRHLLCPAPRRSPG